MKIADNLYGFIWQDNTANNCNTFLINGPQRSEKILIDPGHLNLFSHVADGLKKINVPLADISLVLITHGHPDHMEAIRLLKQKAKIAVSESTYRMLQKYGYGAVYPEPDLFLGEGTLKSGDIALDVIPAPGHEPGSLCFYWPDRKALFSGDVIFSQSIGRTDLPGGSGAALKESIRSLADLDIDYLLPGHGMPVIGRKAVQDNFRMVMDYWFRYI
jgi:glyoxylase-like metal-dependent hydrolase (beta-lactamase superfamily II)